MTILPSAEHVLQKLHVVKRRPDGSWLALCPAHDDREPSLHVSVNGERLLVHCFAGCSPESVCSALGITMADLFLKREPTSTVNGAGLTLSRFAAAKRLDRAFLQSCNVTQTEWFGKPAVAIPYFGADGTLQATRYRIAIDGDRFRWSAGARPKSLLYGAWLLPEWREQRIQQVFVVEGESDCLTLWQAGIPAAGAPGADCLTEANAALLDRFEVVLWREPDAGGTTLLESATKLFGDRLRVIEPPQSAGKDPSELWLQISEREPDREKALSVFNEQMRDLVSSAKIVSSAYIYGVPPDETNSVSFLPLIGKGVSDETKCGMKRTPGGVPYTRGSDLLAMGTAEVDWLWHGIIAKGEITLLSGREKSGKTTLIYALTRCLLRGEPFLMRQTKAKRVLLLEEAPRSVLAEAIERFELGDLFVVLKNEISASKSGFHALCPEIAQIVKSEGIDLIIIDTFTSFSGLVGEQENQSGSVQQALEPLRRLSAGLGVAVLLVHHTNKGGEEYRGSTALGAFVDTIVTFKRADGNRPRHRVLEIIGRHTEETSILIRLEDDGRTYTLDDPQVSALHHAMDAIRKALGESIEPLTQVELCESTGLARQRVSEALQRLVSVGEVLQEGTGKRNDPFRYSIVLHAKDVGFISSETPSLLSGGNETNPSNGTDGFVSSETPSLLSGGNEFEGETLPEPSAEEPDPFAYPCEEGLSWFDSSSGRWVSPKP